MYLTVPIFPFDWAQYKSPNKMYKIEILGTSINIIINAMNYLILSMSLSQKKFSQRLEHTAAPMNRITFTFDCKKSGVLRMKFTVTTFFCLIQN